MSTTLRTRAARLWAYLRSAPGTFLWLTALLATTIVLRTMPSQTAHRFLRHRSTNLHELGHHPVRVLIASAMWLDGGLWIEYVLLYVIFHAPAERWLGTWRWLLILAAAHVGATYLSEGVLDWMIHTGQAPHSDRYTLDYGVSYALAGIQGVLTYHLARPWCWWYAALLTLWYVGALGVDRSFTDVGHLTALLIGFACYPLTRARRTPRWNPSARLRRAP